MTLPALPPTAHPAKPVKAAGATEPPATMADAFAALLAGAVAPVTGPVTAATPVPAVTAGTAKTPQVAGVAAAAPGAGCLPFALPTAVAGPGAAPASPAGPATPATAGAPATPAAAATQPGTTAPVPAVAGDAPVPTPAAPTGPEAPAVPTTGAVPVPRPETPARPTAEAPAAAANPDAPAVGLRTGTAASRGPHAVEHPEHPVTPHDAVPAPVPAPQEEPPTTPVTPVVSPPAAAAPALPTTPGVADVGPTRHVRPALLEAAKHLKTEGGRTSLVIRLDPPELGAVLVRLSVKDGQVDVQLRTPDQAARGDLQAQAFDVQQVLREQGLDLSSFDVTHGDSFGRSEGQERQTPDRATPRRDGGTDGQPSTAHVMDDVSSPQPAGTWL